MTTALSEARELVSKGTKLPSPWGPMWETLARELEDFDTYDGDSEWEGEIIDSVLDLLDTYNQVQVDSILRLCTPQGRQS